MEEHPQPEVWRALMRGELEPDPKRDAGRHLLVCRECRRAVARLAGLVPHPLGAEAYEMPLRRAGQTASETLRRFKEARLQAARELDGAPIIASTPQLTWQRAVAFLAEARGFRRVDADSAKVAALMAEALARKLDPADFPPGAVAQLRADCGVEVGNALRVAGDLARAEKAFVRAALAVADLDSKQIDAGRGALRAEAYATFLIASRRFEEAAALFEDLADSYLARGEEHHAGRVQIRCAVALAYRQQMFDAAHLAARGLGLIDYNQEPQLALAALHNLIGYCAELGAAEQAAALLKSAQPMYKRLGGPLDLLKAKWLAGKIAVKRRSWFSAEATFAKVRSAYRERGLPFHEALVTLDLAMVWLEQGRHRKIFEATEQMLATFRALRIAPEALAALVLLREAAAREAATAALIEGAAGRLEPIAKK